MRYSSPRLTMRYTYPRPAGLGGRESSQRPPKEGVQGTALRRWLFSQSLCVGSLLVSGVVAEWSNAAVLKYEQPFCVLLRSGLVVSDWAPRDTLRPCVPWGLFASVREQFFPRPSPRPAEQAFWTGRVQRVASLALPCEPRSASSKTLDPRAPRC
jgi:hypothetical protein